MDLRGFDGIYGEADTWLSDADIAVAEKIARGCLHQATRPEDDSIFDLDDFRARRTNSRKQLWQTLPR